MEIKRSGTQPSTSGNADWFTGTVRIDPLFQVTTPARTAANAATFEPGGQTAQRSFDAMMEMYKIDIAKIKAAIRG